ncbi:RND family efflux transporter, MFP subunit [Selenomonas ruminantium]|uniref:RND family efflux transporter, MFP subunit n=1 Tax=Selenomonas ruminantium TaxID=971 RepID=A0A1M6WGM2_SELRU|nr:efflux RND transporter periplasmic adaptor subunit [Selenomonas ruminantium]SHK92933.1 RND family efflux transporter, MFP subunit [Selenomonas ruminantium]
MRHKFTTLTNRQKLLAGGMCFCLLAVALYFYMGLGKDTGQQVRRSIPEVRVMEVERRDMLRHIVLSGQTVANASINLAPKYSGRITAVNVDLGDQVEEGQVLMVQDLGDLDISIAQNTAAAGAAWADAREASASYHANIISKKNAYDLAKGKYERQQYLFSIGAISQDTLDSAEKEYTASKAAYEILANQVSDGAAAAIESKELTAAKQDYATEALKKQRDDMVLRAPRSGVITYRNAEVGALAAANSKVFTLVDNSHINIDCNIAENDAAVLQPGMVVSVAIDALGRNFSGRIVFVSPAMGEDSKSYQVRLVLDEMDDAIKAGLFAHTAVDILQRPQTIFVPQEAVVTRNGETYVFVLGKEDKVEQRLVKIGLMNDDSEEIIEGLNEGETVILSNQDKLQNGMKVKVAEL